MRKAIFSSDSTPLVLGGVEIPCYVLDDGTRVITQYGIIKAIGLSGGGSKNGSLRLVSFTSQKRIKSFIDANTMDRTIQVVFLGV